MAKRVYDGYNVVEGVVIIAAWTTFNRLLAAHLIKSLSKS